MHFNTFRVCIGITSLCILLIIERHKVSASVTNNETTLSTTNQNQSKQNHHQASAGISDALTQRSTSQLNAQTSTHINASKTGTANFIKEHHLQKEMSSNEKKSTDISGVFITNTIDAGNNNSVKSKATPKSNPTSTDKKLSISTSSTPFSKATYKTTNGVSSLPSKDTESKKFTSGSPVIIPSPATTKPPVNTKPQSSFSTDMFSKSENNQQVSSSASVASLTSTGENFSFMASNSNKTTIEQLDTTESNIGTTNSQEHATSYKDIVSSSIGVPKPESVGKSTQNVSETKEPWITYPSIQFKPSVEKTSTNSNASKQPMITPITAKTIPSTEIRSESSLETTWFFSAFYTHVTSTPKTESHTETRPIAIEETSGVVEGTTRDTPSLSSTATNPSGTSSLTKNMTSNNRTTGKILTSTEINHTQTSNILTKTTMTRSETTREGMTTYNSPTTAVKTIGPTYDTRSEESTQQASPKETTDYQPSSSSSKVTVTEMTEYQHPTTPHDSNKETTEFQPSSTVHATGKETTKFQLSYASQNSGKETTEFQPSSTPLSSYSETTEFQTSVSSHNSDIQTTELQPSTSPLVIIKEITKIQSSVSSHATDKEKTEYHQSFTPNFTNRKTTKFLLSTSSHKSDTETTELPPSSTPYAHDLETTEYLFTTTSNGETTKYQPLSTPYKTDNKTTTKFPPSSTPNNTDIETTEFLTHSTLHATDEKTTEYQPPSTSHEIDKIEEQTTKNYPSSSHVTDEETTAYQLLSTSQVAVIETTKSQSFSTSHVTVGETTEYQPPSTSYPTDKESTTKFHTYSSSHATDGETTEYQPPSTSYRTDKESTTKSHTNSTSHATDGETTEYQPPSTSYPTDKESTTKYPTYSTSHATDGETTEYQPPSTSYPTDKETTTKSPTYSTSHATDGETTEYQHPSTSYPTDKETTTKSPTYSTSHATDGETTEYQHPSTSYPTDKESTTKSPTYSTSHATDGETTEYQPPSTSYPTDKETTTKSPTYSTSHATDGETTEYQPPSTSYPTYKETTTKSPTYSTSHATDGETTEYQHPSTSYPTDKESTTKSPTYSTSHAADGETTEYQHPSTSYPTDKETTTKSPTYSTSHATDGETTEYQHPSTSYPTDKESTTKSPTYSTSHATDGETTEYQHPSTSYPTDKETTTKSPTYSTSHATDGETTEYHPPSSSSVTDTERETTEYQPFSTPRVTDRETTVYISSMTVTKTDQPPSTSLVTDIETTEYQHPLVFNETTGVSTTDVLTTHAESTNAPHPLITDNQSTEYHSSDFATTEILSINETTSMTAQNTVMGTTTPVLGIETSKDNNIGQTFSTSDTTSERLSKSSVGMSTEFEIQYTTKEHSTKSEIFSTLYNLEITTGVTDTIESKFTESTTTVISDTTGAYQETEPSTTIEIVTGEVSTTTDVPSSTGSTNFTMQYLSTSEGSLLETTKSSTNYPGEETTWSSTVGFSAETTSVMSGMTSPTTTNSAETSPSDEKETGVPVKTTISTTVMESSSISDKTSLFENLTTGTSEKVPAVEFTTLGRGTSLTTEEEGATTAVISHEISTAQKLPSTTAQVSPAFSTPLLFETTSSAETALPTTGSLTQSTRETLGFSESFSTVENEETTSHSTTTSNALSKSHLSLQTTDISTIPSTTQETGSNKHTHISPVHSTIDNIKFSEFASTDKSEFSEETDTHFVTSSNGVSELPQTSSAVLEKNDTTNGAEISTTNYGISQSKGISGHQTTINHQSSSSSSSKTNTAVPGFEPTTLESVTRSSFIPTRDAPFSTTFSVQTNPNIDSAHFEFGIVIWISGTFERNLKDDFKFKSEIILLVKDHFLPLEYHSIFQLEVATVTKGSIKVHVQAKVTVGSLRRINTTVTSAVRKMVNTLESVNYTTLNTSRGKLYDNRGDVRRSFLLHQNDTECDAVDICGSSQRCILSNNNITAVLCNPIQIACYLECGPNGVCVQSVDTTYCRCASDWLNIYYGVNCESRAVSLEAQLGITFGSLGVLFMIIFVGCLIRSRRRDKESFLEDDATGWRGFNGGDSRWSTFSGRYSTRDIPYKRSLRDGRYAHDPFGSGRLTRPGLYLPRTDGLMATSFIDAVPSYSQFNLEADFTIKRPVVSKEPSAIYLTDRSWGSMGYTNPAFYDFVEERTHL